jgi:hypothetical protein
MERAVSNHGGTKKPCLPLSPRRKPGSMNTGLWNRNPGFRRDDIENLFERFEYRSAL